MHVRQVEHDSFARVVYTRRQAAAQRYQVGVCAYDRTVHADPPCRMGQCCQAGRCTYTRLTMQEWHPGADFITLRYAGMLVGC